MPNTFELQLTHDLTAEQVRSMATPYPDFVANESQPASLGYAAHERLEDIFGMPIASDDADPAASSNTTGQQAGFSFGDRIGRKKEFTENLPVIKGSVTQAAAEHGVTESEIWDEILEIMIGSGIGQAMHRTLSRPLGGMYGARDYLQSHADNGVTIIARGGIANWQARRHQGLLNLLGSLPAATLVNVKSIIYAGGSRQLKNAELWRPEIAEHGFTESGEDKVSPLTEASVSELIHAPQTRQLLAKLGLAETISVHIVSNADPNAGGDGVMRAIAASDASLKDRLIVEISNAPAGYTSLKGGLVLMNELAIDPEQFMAVSDSVDLARSEHFEALGAEARSKVQNVATALNSFNGWLQAITDVNRTLGEI